MFKISEVLAKAEEFGLRYSHAADRGVELLFDTPDQADKFTHWSDVVMDYPIGFYQPNGGHRVFMSW